MCGCKRSRIEKIKIEMQSFRCPPDGRRSGRDVLSTNEPAKEVALHTIGR